ncbi:hypothetical protein KFK09_009162 [Dendrobium nobile]|uniref:CASP-like protein n=1 Tax=Dendrobium nobile TaxID=94219 RepID=A0A8T3BN31_DENNO|nr:hypothetical protein KFK09_009162 [Dendrobium nobile]
MMKTASALPVSKQEEEVLDAIESGLSGVRTAETLLRVVPMGFCLAALILTIKISVDKDFGSVSYSDPSFKLVFGVHERASCALATPSSQLSTPLSPAPFPCLALGLSSSSIRQGFFLSEIFLEKLLLII